jgi:hypothetical protein
MNATQRYWVRRAELQERSALLRDRLMTHAVATQPLFGVVEQAIRAGRWMRQHPWVPVLLGAALVVRRPRSVLRWAWKGWQVWRFFSKGREQWLKVSR